MFHCPVGVWVIEQHAIILSATVRSPTVCEARVKRCVFIIANGPITSYVNLGVAHAPGMLGTFSPPLTSKETAS